MRAFFPDTTYGWVMGGQPTVKRPAVDITANYFYQGTWRYT